MHMLYILEPSLKDHGCLHVYPVIDWSINAYVWSTCTSLVCLKDLFFLTHSARARVCRYIFHEALCEGVVRYASAYGNDGVTDKKESEISCV